MLFIMGRNIELQILRPNTKSYTYFKSISQLQKSQFKTQQPELQFPIFSGPF